MSSHNQTISPTLTHKQQGKPLDSSTTSSAGPNRKAYLFPFVLFFLIVLFSCKTTTASNDSSNNNSSNNNSSHQAGSSAWTSKQNDAIREFKNLVALFSKEHQTSPPKKPYQVFESSRYRNSRGLLSQRTIFRLGQLGIQACKASMIRVLAPKKQGGIHVKAHVVKKLLPTQKNTSFYSSRLGNPHSPSKLNQARDLALKNGNLELAAVLDRLGGPAWKKLSKKLPGKTPSTNAFLRERWISNIAISQKGPDSYTIHASTEGLDGRTFRLLLYWGFCQIGFHANPTLRKEFGFGESYNPLETALSFWFVFGSHQKLQIPIQPRGIWALPLLAAMSGNLRGFVVTEVLRQASRGVLLHLDKSDLQAGAFYLKILHSPNGT